MGSPAWIVRLRPLGPWRPGAPSGARDQVDRVLHSDTLFSALTCAFEQLGLLSDWLQATAESQQPAVRFSSCFPFVGRTLLVPAPRNAWPPAATGKVRWKSAEFIPLSLAGTVLRGETPNEDRWAVDPVSRSLLPVEKNGIVTEPFRIATRSSAPVDRLFESSAAAHETACLEFNSGAGLWCLAVFADRAAFESWGDRVRAAFRLLADTGVGGERSSGWGRFELPELEDTSFPELISVPRTAETQTGHWLLSLFRPSENDSVQWSGGAYRLIVRSGRLQARVRAGELKSSSQMVEEGAVLLASSPPVGEAVNVAPEGLPHPVYRAGFAVAVPVPYRAPASFQRHAPVPELAVRPDDALETSADVVPGVPMLPDPEEPEAPLPEPPAPEPEIPDMPQPGPETPGIGPSEPDVQPDVTPEEPHS